MFVKPLLVGVVAIGLALTGALAFETVYKISIRTRAPDATLRHGAATQAPSIHAERPLPIRLVDSGGVGIPLEGWGADYSHDRRAFRDVILEQSPYIDAPAFTRVGRDWQTYVTMMRDYGNNGVVVPIFLELIDFDRLRDRAPYDQQSPFRARHNAVRRAFGPLFDWTTRQGMQVFLESDMLALTPPLSNLLRSVAPHPQAPGIDASDPAVWETLSSRTRGALRQNARN
jgi:hypothetical protein